MNESRLLAFDQKTFLGMLRDSPEACFGLLASMSRRLHMLVNQIESLALQNATYRLVAYLLEQIPREVTASPEVVLTTPKGVIASRLAIQPETLSRILARLRQGGLIEVHGNHITVRDASRRCANWCHCRRYEGRAGVWAKGRNPRAPVVCRARACCRDP